jgi:diguanylate cyclase
MLRVAWLVLLVPLLAWIVTTIPVVRSQLRNSASIDGWLQIVVLVAAALIIGARVILSRTQRFAWGCIAMAVALSACGNILYAGWVQYDHPVPYPSVADIAWLALYGFGYVGIMSLAWPEVRGSYRTLWLDGIVGTLGLTAVATVWLAFLATHSQGSRAAAVTSMAYPVGDLVLLVIVMGTCGLLGWRPGRTWLLFGAGMTLFAALDTVYSIRVAAGEFRAGSILDPMYGVAMAVIAAAALRPPQTRQPAKEHGWSMLAVPSAFVLAALGLLVFSARHHIPTVSIVLATITILTGLMRAGLTFRDVRFLAGSREQARTDELTGLGNRRQFHEVVQARIDSLTGGEHLAVLLIDLDRFKEVNDSFGHPVGDLLLVDAGARLARILRGGDVLARLGGDEFALMLRSSSATDALVLAERLRVELQSAFLVDGVTVYVDASVGIALCPDVATTVDGLLQRADIAMYKAKAERLGAMVYEAGADDDLTARPRRIEELRHAIDDGQLVLHYQPKFNLRTGNVDGVEALVRWNHPEHGLLFPDAFIPDAERYGFMRRLTTVVLALALDQVQQWRTTSGPTNVAVNVSASNLLDTALPDQIQTLLELRNLPGDVLTVEVTEGVLMVDPERAVSVLTRLRALNVDVSIDDYGTGYSSLARLRQLPVTELKLDQSFIREIDHDERAAAIVESTIKLAHSLGLKIVAEGIETESALQRLTSLGCDVGQGYHLGRPAPATVAAGAWTPLLVGRRPTTAQDR